MSKVDEFYNNLFKKLAKEPAKEVCPTCKFAVNSLKDHNKIVHPYAKEADYNEPTYIPQGVQAPDYFSDKLENSPEDNIFVPNDIDEDDQYITNINKLIFNANQTNEPDSAPGQVKKYTEETIDGRQHCKYCDYSTDKGYYELGNHIDKEHPGKPYDEKREGFNESLAQEKDYPWDQCIADNKDKGMDSANKICGSIKAKYGEANDNMNEDLHDSTMNDDGTNEHVGEFPNTEPDAMNTMDTDTAPLAEETSNGVCIHCGKGIDEHNNPQHPIEGREPTDHYFEGKDDGKEADANGPDMSAGLFDQANPDDSTNEFGEQDANTQEDEMANTSDILSEERMVTLDSGAQMKMHSSPEEYWNELGDDKHAVLRSHGITGDQREDLASKDWKDLPEHVKDAIHNNYSPSTTYYDKDLNKITGESEKKRSLFSTESDIKCGTCGQTFNTVEQKTQHYKDEHGATDWDGSPLTKEADYTIGTDNPQDLMDSNKTVGKDFEEGEEYDKNIDTNYKCTDCDQDFGDDHGAYSEHMKGAHDKDVSSEAGVDDEGYYKPDPDETFQCLQCKKDFGNNFKAFFQHSRTAHVNGESLSNEVSIDDFRRIRDNRGAEELQFQDGKDLVDMQTANAIVSVYDRLSPQNQERAKKLIQTTSGVIKMAGIAFGESFAMTGGQYPSEEDKTEDMTSPDDDAANSGAMSEKLNGKMGQELNTWGQDSIQQHTDDATPLENVDGPKTDDYRQAVKDVDAEPSMPMGEAGKSSVGYAFGQMQDVDSKDIPITPAPKFKKKEEPKYDSKHDEPIEEPKDSPHYKGESQVEQDPWFTCPQCSAVFFEEDERNSHVNNAHKQQSANSDNLFESMVKDCGCDKGKEAFYKKLGVDWSKESEIRCEYCDTPFGSDKALTQHLQMYQGDGEHPKMHSGQYVRNEAKDVPKGVEPLEPSTQKPVSEWSEKETKDWNDTYGKKEGDEESPFNNNNWNALGDSPANETTDLMFTCPECDMEFGGAGITRNKTKAIWKEHMMEKHDYTADEVNDLWNEYAGEAKAGVSNDYGKTKPYWCLDCGEGYDEIEPLNKHMKDAGHKGTDNNSNDIHESFTEEWDAMESFQRYEWLVGKVGAYEVLDKFTGVSQYKWGQLDYGARDKILELVKSSAYSYEFKKKDPNVKKKLSEADTREEATEPDIKKWWDDENNISEKQHAVDPNRLWDIESLEFCKKPYDQHDDAGKRNIWIAYSFRHQEKSLTNLLGYDVHASTQPWWDTYNTSQHQHMFDPHQLFPDSLEFASKKYDDMDEQDKTKADQMYEHKHSETSSARSKKDVKEVSISNHTWDSMAPVARIDLLMDIGIYDFDWINELKMKKYNELDEHIQQKLSGESLESLTKLGLEGGHGSGRKDHKPWMSPITKKVKSPETSKDIPIEKINEADTNLTCKRCGRKVIKVYDGYEDSYGPLYVHAIGPRGLMECGPLTKHDVNGATEVWFGEDEPDANHKCPTKNGKCTCDTCDTDVLEGGFVECKNCRLDKPYRHYFDEDENAEEGVLSDYLRRRNGQSYSYCPQCNTVTKHINGMCTNKRPDRLINIPHAPTKQREIAYYDVMNAEPLDVNADDLE